MASFGQIKIKGQLQLLIDGHDEPVVLGTAEIPLRLVMGPPGPVRRGTDGEAYVETEISVEMDEPERLRPRTIPKSPYGSKLADPSQTRAR